MNKYMLFIFPGQGKIFLFFDRIAGRLPESIYLICYTSSDIPGFYKVVPAECTQSGCLRHPILAYRI